MTKCIVIFAMLSGAVLPAYAKTHNFIYQMPCTTLWPAVKDALRTSGKYRVISMDGAEMTASYDIGSVLTTKRVNSLVLNTKEAACELQVQTSFSGLANNDANDLKKRVDDSIAKLQVKPATTPAPSPATPPSPPAAATEQKSAPPS